MGPTAIIAAIIGLVIVFGLCVLMGRRAWMRFGKLEIGVGRIDQTLNHREPGQPTLGRQVDHIANEVSKEFKEMHRRLDVTDERMSAIDQRQKGCENRLQDICDHLNQI